MSKVNELKHLMASLSDPSNNQFGQRLAFIIGDDIDEIYQVHPAHSVHTIKQELNSLLDMLSDCTKAAGEAYAGLRDQLLKTRESKYSSKELELRINKEFYAFVHLAKSLIDVGRRYKNKKDKLFESNDFSKLYDKLIIDCFPDQENSLFINGMRNNLSHYILHRSDWMMSRNFETGQNDAKYVFNGKRLLSRGTWDGEVVKGFLSSNKRIDVYEEMIKYYNQANEFWINIFKHERQNVNEAEAHYLAVLEYREDYSKGLALGLIKQVVMGRPGFNPYDHLDKYFSDNEIRLILAKPQQSSEQMEFMIELVDRRGAIQDNMRRNLYEVFDVSYPP